MKEVTEINKEELLLCPFCGGSPIQLRSFNELWFTIKCSHSGCDAQQTSYQYPDLAKKAWNKRHITV